MRGRCSILAFVLLLASLPGASFGRAGGGCLEEGTLVATPGGSVPIEQLKAGDQVIAWCDGVLVPARVEASLRTNPADYVELRVDGQRLHLTADHPVAVAPGVFKMASALGAGDSVLKRQGDRLRSVPLSGIARIPATRPAYNLLVGTAGTYLAADVLVHNKGCFLPDTPILRADGSQTTICNVRPGDSIRTCTPEGEAIDATVYEVLTHEVDEYLIVSTDRLSLRVTAEHPFYVGQGTFKTLQALRVGERIFAFDGRQLAAQPITGIERVAQRTRVYNLQTDWPHTFIAGSILVHNKGGGCFPAGALVATPEGTAPIEQLRLGQQVLAVDERGRTVFTAVEAVFVQECPVLTVQTDHGVLHTTAEHPMLLAAGNFAEAGTLRLLDRVLFRQAGSLRPALVRGLHAGGQGQTVYNLRVGSPHTFIVDGFVVHNKGGGGFHGSGYRGHGRSGSSTRTSAEDSIVVIAVGAFLLLMLGAWAFVIWKAARRSDSSSGLDRIISNRLVTAKSQPTEALLRSLAQKDREVNPDALRETVQSLFLDMQRCWQQRNYQPLVQRLMPDLWAEHHALLANMLRQHETNVMDSPSVEGVDFVHLRYTHDPEQRQFTILITARAADYYVDDRTGRFLRGSRSRELFQEFYTFQFHRGRWLLREIEQTRESDALKQANEVEGLTPQQVVAVAGTAPVLGGDGPSEAAIGDRASRLQRTLRRLQTTDPLWNPDQMTQRARQVFVRLILATDDPNRTPLPAADLFPQVLQSFRQKLTDRQSRGTMVDHHNLCIRKVEPILARNYRNDDDDEFTVRIVAHAQRIVRRNGQIISQDPDVTPFTEYWTFGRLDGVWKLKGVLPELQGRSAASQPNIDEEAAVHA
jgi:predicted lipid-binding transport protein (Tim44 family)